VAEGHSDREQAILEAHFPTAPGGSYKPPADGSVFVQVDTHLVGYLLAKAANTSAPGDDRISEILSRYSGNGTLSASCNWSGRASGLDTTPHCGKRQGVW